MSDYELNWELFVDTKTPNHRDFDYFAAFPEETCNSGEFCGQLLDEEPVWDDDVIQCPLAQAIESTDISELVSELKSLRTLADSYIPIAKSVGNINLLALSSTFKARLDAILKELDVD